MTGNTILSQGRPGSTCNEEVLHISIKYQDWNLTTRWIIIISRIFIGGGGGILLLYRDAVGIFYSPSQLGREFNEQYHKKKSRSLFFLIIFI